MDEAQYVLLKELEERKAVLMKAREDIVRRVLLENPEVAAIDGAIGEVELMLGVAKNRADQA